MIQTQIKEDIITNDIGNTTKMSIALDEANQAHIVKVLSENYKYPIASTIREAASNAWDSHLMNNTNESLKTLRDTLKSKSFDKLTCQEELPQISLKEIQNITELLKSRVVKL